MKTCKNKDCTENNPQPIENFVKDSRCTGGYQNQCKSCKKKYDALRFEKNRTRILTQSKTYYESNLDSARKKRAEWRRDNKEYAAEYGKIYRAMYPGKGQARTRKYALSKRNAVPRWLSVEQLKEITLLYENCPKGYEVDHIIPLQGKNVKGLHVPWNLQYLTREDNRKKGNKY